MHFYMPQSLQCVPTLPLALLQLSVLFRKLCMQMMISFQPLVIFCTNMVAPMRDCTCNPSWSFYISWPVQCSGAQGSSAKGKCLQLKVQCGSLHPIIDVMMSSAEQWATSSLILLFYLSLLLVQDLGFQRCQCKRFMQLLMLGCVAIWCQVLTNVISYFSLSVLLVHTRYIV